MSKTPQDRPLRVGVIGMGGFASAHHDAINKLEQEGRCKLVCTCDPDPGTFLERMDAWKFAKREVMVFDHYIDMLNACVDELDLVTIPTPVPLHAEMHRACVERNLAVYLEKPPTLDIAELNSMIQVEANARHMTNVGFNFIVEPARQMLKQRLLAGEFGALRKVCLSGLWPRSRDYFTRNGWAGRLMLDDRLVLDSCLGNAMAHYAHNVLFWAGIHALFDWASMTRLRAELYRAHDIEGTDTLFIAGVTTDGVDLRIALSHACDGPSRHYERVECEHATIHYVTNSHYALAIDGQASLTTPVPVATLHDNLAAHFDYLNGTGLSHPLTSLADSQPFVELNDLAYIASRQITTIAPEHLCITTSSQERSELVAIQGIDQVYDRFFKEGLFPSDQGLPWAHQGGEATRDDLPSLRHTIQRMSIANNQA